MQLLQPPPSRIYYERLQDDPDKYKSSELIMLYTKGILDLNQTETSGTILYSLYGIISQSTLLQGAAWGVPLFLLIERTKVFL